MKPIRRISHDEDINYVYGQVKLNIRLTRLKTENPAFMAITIMPHDSGYGLSLNNLRLYVDSDGVLSFFKKDMHAIAVSLGSKLFTKPTLSELRAFWSDSEQRNILIEKYNAQLEVFEHNYGKFYFKEWADSLANESQEIDLDDYQ